MASHEELLTRSLWNLFSKEGPQSLAKNAIYRQLITEHSSSRAAAIFSERLLRADSLAWPPPHSLGPDLVLLSGEKTDGKEEILAVIEVKILAQANGTLRNSAELLPEHKDDRAAQDIRARVWDPEWTWVHAKRDEPAMSQIDVYRSREWWTATDDVFMSDPENVVWLLFDVRGRTAKSVFEDSVRPDVWLTIDLEQFARDLHSLRLENHAGLTGSDNDIIATVTWLIGQWVGRVSIAGWSESLLSKDEPRLLDAD